MLRKGLYLADRYEILDQVGTGGMSDVYKAKCHKLNRFVAIKVLKSEYSADKTFVSKFRAEAQSAAGLTHPNVVSVYDVGDEDGIHYIVMELVEGITLKKYIQKRGKISYKEAVSIAIQVAKGMEAAHSHHIVHRDIKPQNIIISKEGKVKVTDFGIAKAATSSTINSSAMGSVHYISPEQARGGYSDERSDIYSFGITLFEMLTGTVPFDGDSTVSVAVQHIQDEIPAPSEFVDDVPISVDKIVLKCTQKKTERRYQTVSELVDDLKKSLVMPEEDFVTIASAYGGGSARLNTAVSNRTANGFYEEEEILDEELEEDFDSEEEEETPDDWNDELNDDDDMLDDELDDEFDRSVRNSGKKERAKQSGFEPDDDDREGKLDTAMKWIGICIIALILIITVVLVIKLFGRKNPDPSPAPSTVSTQDTATQPKEELVEVPAVEGLTEEEAKKKLNERGLGYKPSNQPSTTVEAGTVIQQNTKAGTMVGKNSTIILVISIGPESVVVPNVVGYKQVEAAGAIEALGLQVAAPKEEFSDQHEAGTVIRLEPEVGTLVAPDAKITMIISKGKEKVTVPRLVGLSQDKATELLNAQGLKWNIVEVADASAPYNQVIHQAYDPEDSVEKGTEITITVSKNTSYGQTEAPTNPPTQPESTAATEPSSTEKDSESSSTGTAADN